MSTMPGILVGSVVDDIQMQASGARTAVAQQIGAASRRVRGELQGAGLLMNEKNGKLLGNDHEAAKELGRKFPSLVQAQNRSKGGLGCD
eukprot:3800255-Pyramimonas_sp.AAC.1